MCLFLEIVAIILVDVLSERVRACACVFIICQAHFCFITWGLMYSDI